MKPESAEAAQPQFYDDPSVLAAAETDSKLQERLRALELAQQWLGKDPSETNRQLRDDMEAVARSYCQDKGLIPPDPPPIES